MLSNNPSEQYSRESPRVVSRLAARVVSKLAAERARRLALLKLGEGVSQTLPIPAERPRLFVDQVNQPTTDDPSSMERQLGTPEMRRIAAAKARSLMPNTSVGVRGTYPIERPDKPGGMTMELRPSRGDMDGRAQTMPFDPNMHGPVVTRQQAQLRELEGPNPLSSPEAAPMNPDELRALRLAARNRVFDADRNVRMLRATTNANNNRFADPAARAAGWSDLRRAEANMNDVQGDYNAARDVGRTFQTPEQHAIAIAALRKQLEQNTGATGGRVGPEATPNPKDMATQFFLGNGAERYQGATQVATDLAGANIRRQSLNADQNVPRGAEFDSPINYEERAARLAAAKRWQNSPETTLDLQAGRDQQMLADKARRAGTEAAGNTIDTGVESSSGDLERARMATAIARRGTQSANDNELYDASRADEISGHLANVKSNEAKGSYAGEAGAVALAKARLELKRLESAPAVTAADRSAAREAVGMDDKFLERAGTMVGRFDDLNGTESAPESENMHTTFDSTVVKPIEDLASSGPVGLVEAKNAAAAVLARLKEPASGIYGLNPIRTINMNEHRDRIRAYIQRLQKIVGVSSSR